MSDLSAKMTALGEAKLSAYVQGEKRRMKLFPLPDMSAHNATLWDRLLGTRTAYAGGMKPYGSGYTTYSFSNGTLYATGVTDTSASCQCHQSQVSVAITAPGGYGGTSSPYGAAYEQADGWYVLNAGDFTDGSIEVFSTYYSYCPVGQVVFLNTGWTDWLPLRSIIAYYKHATGVFYSRCNPNGNCDSGVGIPKPRYPDFALLKVAELNVRGFYGCLGNLEDVVYQCYSPDPKP